ncbi:hypothetical protein [Sphingobium sp. HWE2-09]|nr:hypothetical protein [Sphingobium sp. HWE2-09]
MISRQGYLQVKAGKRYTLAKPVGLYISGLDTQRVFTKDGEPMTG